MKRFYAWCKSAIRAPLFYAVVYVLCIPSFGVVYWLFSPGSFYAPYAKYEPAAQGDLTSAASILDTALHRTMASSSRSIEIADWKFDNFKVQNVRARDSGGIRFEVLFRFESAPPPIQSASLPAEAHLYTTVIANIPGNGYQRVGIAPGDLVYYRSMYIEPNVELAMRDEFYKSSYSFLTLPTSIDKGRTFQLSPRENEKLSALFTGLAGNPVTISQGWRRMTYFSAVVLTTTGFGDIIPMTPTARFTVAFEAVFGIVIAGFFVNAATRRRQKSATGTDPPMPTDQRHVP
jgi:Ion channel